MLPTIHLVRSDIHPDQKANSNFYQSSIKLQVDIQLHCITSFAHEIHRRTEQYTGAGITDNSYIFCKYTRHYLLITFQAWK